MLHLPRPEEVAGRGSSRDTFARGSFLKPVLGGRSYTFVRLESVRQGELHRQPGVRTLIRTIFCVFDFLEPRLAGLSLERSLEQITLMKRCTERHGKTVGCAEYTR